MLCWQVLGKIGHAVLLCLILDSTTKKQKDIQTEIKCETYGQKQTDKPKEKESEDVTNDHSERESHRERERVWERESVCERDREREIERERGLLPPAAES